MTKSTTELPSSNERSEEPVSGQVSDTVEAVAERPPVGSLVVDSRRDRLGVVMGHVGPCCQLRPERGGREWDARPSELRPATDADKVRLRVREANERSTGAKL